MGGAVNKDAQGLVVTPENMAFVDPAVLEALKRLHDAIENSKKTLLDDAARKASQISDNVDQQLRLDPAFLLEQITL
jgi:hypothetical protein